MVNATPNYINYRLQAVLQPQKCLTLRYENRSCYQHWDSAIETPGPHRPRRPRAPFTIISQFHNSDFRRLRISLYIGISSAVYTCTLYRRFSHSVMLYVSARIHIRTKTGRVEAHLTATETPTTSNTRLKLTPLRGRGPQATF